MNLALFLCAIVAAVLLGANGPLYWDGFNYVSQAITGTVGGLVLGRPLFVQVSHGLVKLWTLTGHSVWTAEPMLRTFWLALSATGPVLLRLLVLECGLSARAALLAGIALAVSPAMAHTSNAVLTDAPAVTVVLGAYLLALRATSSTTPSTRPDVLALLSGALLGIAFGLRETSAFHALALALSLLRVESQRRFYLATAMITGFALTAVPPVLYPALTQQGYTHSVSTWFDAMKRERALHPYRWIDLVWFLAWLVCIGPAVLATAVYGWVIARRSLFRPTNVLFLVCVPSLAQLLLLAVYQDISFSPRYLLGAVPGALCVPAAVAVDRLWGDDPPSRRAGIMTAVLLLVPIFVGVGLIRTRQQRLVRALRETPVRLESVPRPAVVVTGQPCPAIDLYMTQLATTGHPVTWEKICPGWSWPEDLAGTLDRALARGEHIVADLREEAWPGVRQQQSLGQLHAWLLTHTVQIEHGEVILWR